MSNTYGFDFLKTEHLGADVGVAGGASAAAARAAGDEDHASPPRATAEEILQAQNKPDLEKQFDILHFLQAHRGSGSLAPSIIYKSTGIDLEVDTVVAEMLQKNPKIRVEMVPDPENPELSVATYRSVRACLLELLVLL